MQVAYSRLGVLYRSDLFLVGGVVWASLVSNFRGAATLAHLVRSWKALHTIRVLLISTR